MSHPRPLIEKVRERIHRSGDRVFLMSELRGFGDGRSGVKRVASELVRNNELVRLGVGVYAKTRVSTISGKRIMAGPLPDVGREALRKLRIPLVLTGFERELRDGRSTQVPTGRVVGVGKRTSRKLSYQGQALEFERV